MIDPPADFPPDFLSGPVPIDIGIEQCRYFYGKIFREFFDFLDGFLATGVHLVVRPFEKHQFYGHDVVSDFLNLLGARHEDHSGGGPEDDPIIVNPSRSRKFCDVSTLVWKTVQSRGEQAFYNLSLVEAVYTACRSGDDRPVVATLPDELIASIYEEFRFVESALSLRLANTGKDVLVRKMPSVFGHSRPSLVPIDERELNLLVNHELLMLQARTAEATIGALQSEKDEVRSALAVALAERDEGRTALEAALAERDQARLYPWKYLKHALRSRIGDR